MLQIRKKWRLPPGRNGMRSLSPAQGPIGINTGWAKGGRREVDASALPGAPNRKRTESRRLCPFILGFPRCRYFRGEIFAIIGCWKPDAKDARTLEKPVDFCSIQYLCQTIKIYNLVLYQNVINKGRRAQANSNTAKRQKSDTCGYFRDS